MAKYKPLFLLALVIVSVAGGYLLAVKTDIRNAEREMLERISEQSAFIGFWNKTNMPISIKMTSGRGDIRWFSLPRKGGSYASYEPGNALIERILDEKSMYAVEVTLDEGARVEFNVYEDKLVPY